MSVTSRRSSRHAIARGRRRPRITRLVVAGAAAFGLGAGFTAAAPGQGGGGLPFASEQPITAIPASESTDFGILRLDQGPNDAFGTADAMPAGANPDLARSVEVPTSSLSTGRVWVVPADGAICLRVVDGADGDGWVCASTADAAAGKLIGSLRTSPEQGGPAFVHGLTPDGVTQVTAVGPDGNPVDVPVTDNVYGITVDATPATVTYTPPGGQTVTLDVP